MVDPVHLHSDAGLVSDLLRELGPEHRAAVLACGPVRRARIAAHLAAAHAGGALFVTAVPKVLTTALRQDPGAIRRTLMIAGPLEHDELTVRIREVASSTDGLVVLEPERLWNARMARALHGYRPPLVILELSALAVGVAERMWLAEQNIRRLEELIPGCAIIVLAHPIDPDRFASLCAPRQCTVHNYGAPLPAALRLDVRAFADSVSSNLALISAVRDAGASALLIAATRGAAQSLAEFFRTHGLDAAAVHAGLTSSERAALLTAYREGRQRVLVCTEALNILQGLPCPSLLAFAQAPRSLDSLVLLAERAEDSTTPVPLLVYDCAPDRPATAGSSGVGVPSLPAITRVYRALQHGAVHGSALIELDGGEPGSAQSPAVGLSVLALVQAGYLARRSDFARAITVTRLTADDAALQPLARVLALRQGVPVPADPLQVAAQLTWTPQRLHAWLLDAEARGDILVRTIGRGALFSVLDQPRSARNRVSTLVRAASQRATNASAQVRSWIDDDRCRSQSIAATLGWPEQARCGRCDRCLPPTQSSVAPQRETVILRALSQLPQGLPRNAAARAARNALAEYSIEISRAAADQLLEQLLERDLLEERSGPGGSQLSVSSQGSQLLNRRTAPTDTPS